MGIEAAHARHPARDQRTRFGKDHGAVAVNLHGREHGLFLSVPHFWPLYEKAEELGLAVAVHAGANSLVSQRFNAVSGHIQSVCESLRNALRRRWRLDVGPASSEIILRALPALLLLREWTDEPVRLNVQLRSLVLLLRSRCCTRRGFRMRGSRRAAHRPCPLRAAGARPEWRRSRCARCSRRSSPLLSARARWRCRPSCLPGCLPA